jgi:hypothetical protein
MTHVLCVLGERQLETRIARTKALLAEQEEQCREGGLLPHGLYVWWGLPRARRYQAMLRLREELQLLGVELEDEIGGDHFLFLTDGRSLYQARVTEMSWDNEAWRDPESVPEPVQGASAECDCYLQVKTVRAMVRERPGEVAEQLRRFRLADGRRIPRELDTLRDKPQVVYRLAKGARTGRPAKRPAWRELWLPVRR